MSLSCRPMLCLVREELLKMTDEPVLIWHGNGAGCRVSQVVAGVGCEGLLISVSSCGCSL